MSCLEWIVFQDPWNLCLIACELNILCLWPWGKHQVQHIHDHIYTDILHSPFQVLHNGQIILYNRAPLSSEYLIPCLVFSSTFSSYICKYAASEDVFDSNMTVGSQIKLWGDFLIMIYCFLGCGLLNDSFTVRKSIICIHIVIYTH